jgi:hypothetical protein
MQWVITYVEYRKYVSGRMGLVEICLFMCLLMLAGAGSIVSVDSGGLLVAALAPTGIIHTGLYTAANTHTCAPVIAHACDEASWPAQHGTMIGGVFIQTASDVGMNRAFRTKPHNPSARDWAS